MRPQFLVIGIISYLFVKQNCCNVDGGLSLFNTTYH